VAKGCVALPEAAGMPRSGVWRGWIPAFAGMTGEWGGNDEMGRGNDVGAYVSR
jgi:hypothetical protein